MKADETIEATGRVEVGERRGEPFRAPQVEARLEEMRGVEAQPDPGVAVDRVDHRRELGEVHAHGAAGAGRALEKHAHRGGCPGLLEGATQGVADAGESRLEAGALMRADVRDDGIGAELFGRGDGACRAVTDLS